MTLKRIRWFVTGMLLVVLVSACQMEELPTPVPPAATLSAVEAEPTVEVAAVEIPATWTAVPIIIPPTATMGPTELPPASSTPIPTVTAVPATATQTPEPTPTITAVPTSTPIPPTSLPAPAAPPPPAQPTISANPVLGGNLLTNGSFEGGWYNQNGIPELQLPNGWAFAYDEGANPLDPAPHNAFVRPETRVLSKEFIPPAEHSLFFADGEYTIKLFKGYGATSFRIWQDVSLSPGVYVMEIKAFPDMVVDWVDGRKIWAPDPYSGELRFMVGDGGSGWIQPAFGRLNTHTYTFTLDQPATLRIGVAFRGRFAIANNGWFTDDWSLRRVEG